MHRRTQDVHYTESGISNLVLEGVAVWVCPNGHDPVIELPDVDALYQRLSESIVVKPGPLAGEEVRFLRKQLGFASKEYARLIGITPVHLSRSENSDTVSRLVDRVARLVYVQGLAARGVRFPHDLLELFARLPDKLESFEHRLRVIDAAERAGTDFHVLEWRAKHVALETPVLEDISSVFDDLIEPSDLADLFEMGRGQWVADTGLASAQTSTLVSTHTPTRPHLSLVHGDEQKEKSA